MPSRLLADGSVRSCTSYSLSFGNQYAGTLRIHKAGRYSISKGRKGSFKTKGKVMRFKTGVYRGVWVGKWRRSRGNPAVIGLCFPDGRAFESEGLICSKSRK